MVTSEKMYIRNLNGAIAQLADSWLSKLRVASSNLVCRSTILNLNIVK